jgi:hypothetical protein
MGMYDDEDSDLVKRLRKEIDDRDKALKERDQEIAGYRTKETQRTIAETFQARGVNPALARFALADLQDDISPEKVTSWIDENGALFGVQAAPQQGQQAPAADPYRRMAAVEQGSQPAVSADDLEQIRQMSPEELWRSLGGQ